MYVCLCKGLTESDIQRIGQSSPHSFEGLQQQLVDRLGLDDEECCGRCARNIHELVAIANNCWTCGSQPTLDSY